MSRLSWLVGCIALLSAPWVSAQAMSNAEREATFLQIQKDAIAKRGKAVQRRGRNNEVAQLLAHLKATEASQKRSPASRDAYLEDQAQRLALTGFSIGKLKALEARSIDVASAVDADFQGSLEQYATLSELVVIAKVTDVVSSDPTDGFLSSVILDVEETLKGKAAAKQIILRELSGRTSADSSVTYSHELTEKSKGDRFLLFLSNGMYEAEAARHGGDGTQPDRYIQHRLGYRIVANGRIEPIEFGPPAVAGGLEEARKRIADIARVFAEVEADN